MVTNSTDSRLGGRNRPFDPQELPYRATAAAPPDFTKRYALPDDVVRATPVTDQSTIGSCTACTVTTCIEFLMRICGRPVVQVARLQDYWDSRVKQNFFGQGQGADTGAYLADAFDVALAGLTREDLIPYVADATRSYDPALNADRPNQDILAAHRPTYATDPGGFLGGVAEALDKPSPEPFAVAMGWYSGFYDVRASGGVLPEGAAMGQLVGYHAIAGSAILPAQQTGLPWPVARLHQSWGLGYTGDEVRRVDPTAKPGDFFIPLPHFQNGVVTEVRIASTDKVIVPDPPKPEPPKPQPGPGDLTIERVQAASDAQLTLMVAREKASKAHARYVNRLLAEGGGEAMRAVLAALRGG